MANNLLNEKATRDFIYKQFAALRPGWKPARISKQTIYNLDIEFRQLIKRHVKSHPSIGKTVQFEYLL